MENDTEDIMDTVYSDELNTEVYATKTSAFSICIPKTIILDGNTKEGFYRVKVKGDISGNQKIAITAPDQFNMYEQDANIDKKDAIIATIYNEDNNGAKISWKQNEIKKDTYDGSGTTIGKISAHNMTAGSWKGVFDFSIYLLNGSDFISYTNDYHKSVIDGTVKEHNFKENTIIKPATCTEDGVKEYICECGEKRNEVIDSFGHDYEKNDTKWNDCI